MNNNCIYIDIDRWIYDFKTRTADVSHNQWVQNISYKNNRIYSIKWQHRKNHIMIMDLLSILF